MGELINLRRARKARDRAASDRQAAVNRLDHGRSKIEKQTMQAEHERRERTLDGVKRDPD